MGNVNFSKAFKSGRAFLYLIVAVMLMAFVTSCVSDPYGVPLKYKTSAAGASMGKALSVGTVKNMRDDKTGGKSETQIGNVRNTYGMPFNVTSKGKVEVSAFMKDLAKDAIAQAGYELSTSGTSVALDVRKLWCDGYGGVYNLVVLVDVRLVDANGADLAKKSVEFEQPFTYNWGWGEVTGAWEKGMTRLASEVAKVLASSEFSSKL